MFDFDAGKLVIIGIVALIVIGPKDLPRVMRQVGNAVGKMRRLAADFQGQFMEAMREADVADIKADVAKLADSAKLDVDFNPVRDVRNHIENAVVAAPSVSEAHDGASVTEHEPAVEQAVAELAPAAPEGEVSSAAHHEPPAAPREETASAPHTA